MDFVWALLPDPAVERFDVLDLSESGTDRSALKLPLEWFSM